jgi:hypothetical protein
MKAFVRQILGKALGDFGSLVNSIPQTNEIHVFHGDLGRSKYFPLVLKYPLNRSDFANGIPSTFVHDVSQSTT